MRPRALAVGDLPAAWSAAAGASGADRRGSATPRFHGQRDRGSDLRRAGGRAGVGSGGARKISTTAACESCIGSASATTQPDCCGWPATQRGCGSPSTRAPTRWSSAAVSLRRPADGDRAAGRHRAAAAGRRARPGRGVRGACAVRARRRDRARLRSRRPRAGRERAGAARTTAATPGAVVLAVASLGIDRAGRADFFSRLGFDAARRELIVAITRTAPRLATRLRRARAASSVAAAVDGAPVEAVALAGALGATDNARRWIEQLRGVTPVDRRRRSARGRSSGRPGGRRWTAGGTVGQARRSRRRSSRRARRSAASGAHLDGPGRRVASQRCTRPRRSTSSQVISRSSCRARGRCSRLAAAVAHAVPTPH